MSVKFRNLEYPYWNVDDPFVPFIKAEIEKILKGKAQKPEKRILFCNYHSDFFYKGLAELWGELGQYDKRILISGENVFKYISANLHRDRGLKNLIKALVRALVVMRVRALSKKKK